MIVKYIANIFKVFICPLFVVYEVIDVEMYLIIM